MDYMEMMIENNKRLFAGEVPFYAEEPTYPEVEEIEEDCGTLYDGYYGYGIIMVNLQMMNMRNYFQEY